MKLTHEQIQYIEFLSSNLTAIKEFYTKAFDWKFTDYGPEYTAFEGEFVDGGFARGEVMKGSILVILYSNNLEETKSKVEAAAGNITKDIFSFPGGRRFHFTDPDGNELAVWSDI
jgi:predicted enzyme related to lactoylglutathione lyase